MAAAALSRSRGVAGVRTTRGLFFIFTLLCLVCLASSLFDKNQLEEFKENLQKRQEDMDRLKAERVTTSELMSEYWSLMEPMMALMKKTSEASSDDFLPMEGILESLKDFMEKTKTFVDGQIEKLDESIETTEQNLGQSKKFLNFLEEQQAEL